jgi:murein DD-endopeptidase MepM/ murein hydrolase activator NlpD
MQKAKRIFSVLFSFVILSATIIYYVPEEKAEARTIAQVENDIKECQKLIESLQNEQKSISAEISKISDQSSVTKDMLNTYIKEIDSLEAEIELTEATIETYNVKLSELEAEIEIKNEDIAYYTRMYDSIVRYSFEQGNPSIFQILFESEDFSDFLTRLDNINYFLNYTDSIKTSLKTARSELETAQEKQRTAKAELEKYVSDLEVKKATATQKKNEFESKAQSLGVTLQSMKGSYSSKSTAISQANAKLAALKKELAALQAASSAGYAWPLKSGVSYRISDVYGNRPNPFNTSKTEFHKGIDIACAYGTPILAANGGTVIRSEYSGGYGNVVVILHSGGISTLYGHCSKRAVSVGQTVKQGDVIAYVGSTGSSTGNHLHYSVLQNSSTYINPYPNYIPKAMVDKGRG